MTFLRRLAHVLLIQFTIFDIWVLAALRSPFYVILGKSKPSARQTISGHYGRAAAEGYWWGRAGAAAINWLFRDPDHCANAARFEAGVGTDPY